MFATRHGVAEGDWDSALQAIHGHFLQSTPWQRVQRALGHEVLHARGEGWMWAGAVRAGWFPRYLYVPYGPAVSHGADAALAHTVTAARQERLDFVRAEPVGSGTAAALARSGATRARAIQPRWTWVLDIARDLDALRTGMSAGHRGSINAAARRGLRIRSTRDPADIQLYIDVERRAAGRAGFPRRPEAYHRTVASVLMPLDAATLYVADAGEAPVAAALCFDFGATRYYAHAVSDPDQGRRLGAAAPLVWTMLVDAREQGRHTFDFWGVTPEADQDHPWAGFTRFKMAFGGRMVERPGTWDIAVRAMRYRMYVAARTWRG